MATSFDSTLSKLGINRTAAGPTVQSSQSTALGQADFLKLMTAQMKNQDPFDPVDNTQMVAQMAQFSSLAGISEMSGTLKAISERLGATTASDAAAYVGRTVLVEGNVAYPRASGGIAGAVELDAGADDVVVAVSGVDGQVLKTLSLGPQAAGTATFDWDGTTDAGEPAGAGPYTVRAVARSGNKAVAGRTLVWAPVESVSAPASGSPVLTVTGLGPVKPSAVRQLG